MSERQICWVICNKSQLCCWTRLWIKINFQGKRTSWVFTWGCGGLTSLVSGLQIWHLDKILFSLKTQQRPSVKTSRRVVIGIWEHKKQKWPGEINQKKKLGIREKTGGWERKIMSLNKESRSTEYDNNTFMHLRYVYSPEACFNERICMCTQMYTQAFRVQRKKLVVGF